MQKAQLGYYCTGGQKKLATKFHQPTDIEEPQARVGMCAVIVAFFVSFYYNVIIGWALYYLVGSLSSELPWLYCNNTWNTDSCTHFQFNSTNSTDRAEHSPASEYFRRGVLEMDRSDGLHDLGLPKLQLAICVFVVYCVLYLSLFKGVKSTGKVVWATATMPYVVLTILLVRGLMLPGAMTGIKYYLQPELSKLKETQVWVDAAVQIFYSVGAGFGVHLAYASYNNFNNNCFSDCIITSAVNSFTSFFSGFVIFTYLGFMSHKQGIPISSVATEGAGLVFQVYPEAVATLPGSHFWSLLFFFMLIMLGLDSGVRILIDCESQRSFISSKCVQNLGITGFTNPQALRGFGDSPIKGWEYQTRCILVPKDSLFPSLETDAVIVPNITDSIPTSPIPSDHFINHYNLADNSFGEPGPVDFLLGADLFARILTGGCIDREGYPNVLQTVFGWVIIRPVGSHSMALDKSVSLVTSYKEPEDTLNITLEKFWNVEAIPEASRTDPENVIAEDHFRSAHSRDLNGRYIGRLPFERQVPPDLGNSYKSALNRFLKLEHRLNKVPILKEKYSTVIK
ncbi:unnamed protein product [Nezara viridula]|uniref:Uncharacterized protein n=1 Tax=Nezara viridula TaxID=85310 RepID=A0A9P0EAX2_NEZVI|nr:unnamed protein product [Nezara viridula]